MAIQFSVQVRNARANAIETTIGASPVLEVRSGPPPVSCAAPDSGTLLLSITLPSDWMADASSGVKPLAGVWQGTVSTAGDPGHFRIKSGGVCHIQGTAGHASSNADLVFNSTAAWAVSQVVTVTIFTITEGGA